MNFFQINSEGSYIVTVPIMEIYLPLELKDAFVIEKGDICDLFGSYYYRIFNTEKTWQDRKDVSDKFSNTFFATFFTTVPSERDIEELTINGHERKEYMVFRYFKGDALVLHQDTIKNINNDKLNMKAFLAGKLSYLDYDDMIRSIHYCTMICGINHRVNSYMYGIMAPKIYRDPSNDNEARFMKDPRVVVGYNPREITAKSSTHTAITFEEPATMVLVSDNKVRKGVKEPDSPLELALKGDTRGLE